MSVRWLFLKGRALVCATVAVGLIVVLAPALAVGAEAPQTLNPGFIAASEAAFEGVLNPGVEGEPGTYEIDSYEFLYKASKTECEGGGHAPESPGMSLGAGKERVSQNVSGLDPGTEYTVCLLARNPKGETTVGAPVTFTTALPPEEPETMPATEITATTATLHGLLSPHHQGEVGNYQFLYRPSASECEGTGEKRAPQPEGVALGDQGETVELTVTDLRPATTYAFCVFVRNENFEAHGQPITFTTPAAVPSISEETIVNVSSNSVKVSAKINPGGLVSGYHVEYVSEAQFQANGWTEALRAPGSDAIIPATNIPLAVLQELSGLQPGTHYHFRLLASNSLGVGYGTEMVLTTAASIGVSGSVLPDGRVYELVSSPVENMTVSSLAGSDHGPSLFTEDEESPQPFRASADGGSVAYPGYPSVEGGSGAEGATQSNEYVATRGPAGWRADDVTAPGADASAEYVFFSSDLSVGAFFADNGTTIASSPASPGCNRNVYSRSSDGSYHALATPVSRQTACDGGNGGPREFNTSEDGSHLLFMDEAPLTAGAERGKETEEPAIPDGGYNLYDSVAGRLYQVNILPDGQPESAPVAWFGSPPGGVQLPSADFSNAVSFDGSRIFWTSSAPPIPTAVDKAKYRPKALYVRENDTRPQSPIGSGGECTVSGDACTVQVDAGDSQCVAEANCTSGNGLFWTASGDGSKVFFADENRLTANSTATTGEPDLYEYELSSEAGKPGMLTDLTVAKAGAHANVQGLVGASEDGSYIYFVADGVLSIGANAEGHEPIAGQPNLYVRHDGTTSFIAGLSLEDNGFSGLWESFGDWHLPLGNRTAAVTPDGHEAVFLSHLDLTGYDNEGSEGNLAGEVFVYDALRERISCASCDPSGAAPPLPVSTRESSLPVPGSGGKAMAAYTQRWISADGSRVFFDTFQPLTPQDTDGRADVYEWERNGAGSCTTVAAGEAERGCVYLLSGGDSSDNSYFADSDANGDNVFFTSRGHLTPQARNENVAMYDARVDGGFPEFSTACTGTGCQGVPPAPPVFATPSSVTFSGVGNFSSSSVAVKPKSKKLATCKRGFVKKHDKCVKRKAKKSRRKAKRSSKSSNGRGK